MDIALSAVEEGFRHQAAGTATNSPRSRIRIEGGFFNFMSAEASGLGVMGGKSYGAIGGKMLHFYVQIFNSEDGRLLAVLEASRLGQIRTGAASGVATRYIAPENARSVGIIGAGYQARTQLEATCAVRDIEVAKVYSRSSERREKFAKEMGKRFGIDVRAVDSAEECVHSSDIVITITTSSRPILNGKWLSQGTHVNAAGANHWMRREIDDEVVTRADVVVADDVDQAKVECGDLLQPIERGLLQWRDVLDLHRVVSRESKGRSSDDQITLFVSQGMALEDIAVAERVYRLANEQGVGVALDA